MNKKNKVWLYAISLELIIILMAGVMAAFLDLFWFNFLEKFLGLALIQQLYLAHLQIKEHKLDQKYGEFSDASL